MRVYDRLIQFSNENTTKEIFSTLNILIRLVNDTHGVLKPRYVYQIKTSEILL